MRTFIETTAAIAAVAAFAGTASAADITVSSDILVDTTWTSNNTYALDGQVYVRNGASLTIEAGTHVISDPVDQGSLAVSRGSQIFVLGTADDPVIMTSALDAATWVGGDPQQGTWREGANEWGNLTICGEGYVSENVTIDDPLDPDFPTTNVPTFNASNFAIMEGLTAAFAGDTRHHYGGGDDDDDSGTIQYLSLRYGGKVIGQANELNGLSLGGVGRGTTIDHIDIMNNVDDGVEIWGGTCELAYVNIWNIGDDSFDIDQGWRGKAQFVNIVQGYSVVAKQGSGFGDNGFETDGAEDSDWQPVTTATIYNATFIGNNEDGDGATAWRDNARVQYRNSIFMDCGEQVVRPDGDDGDGASGYGHNGTLSFADHWTTAYNAAPAHPNDPANPALFYLSQVDGNLCEITDSVFFRNEAGNAYTEANARGVFDAANNNVNAGNGVDDMPIARIVRGAIVTNNEFPPKAVAPVIFLDPRPCNDALTSVGAAPNDGFFTPADYRGAFAPGGGPLWTSGWTAADNYGFTAGDAIGTPFCFGDGEGATDCPCMNHSAAGAGEGCLNSQGQGAILSGSGSNVVANDDLVLTVTQARPGQPCLFVQGRNTTSIPFKDAVLCAAPPTERMGVEFLNGSGSASSSFSIVTEGNNAPGDVSIFQTWYRDPTISPCGSGSNFTQALRLEWQ